MLSGESRVEINTENAVWIITTECGVRMWGTGKKMEEGAFDVRNMHSEHGNTARIAENTGDDAVSTAGDAESTAEVQKMGAEHGERRKQGRPWEMQSEVFRNSMRLERGGAHDKHMENMENGTHGVQ